MGKDEKEDFKVIDKRHSHSTGDDEDRKRKTESMKGDGFVMKETPASSKEPSPSEVDFSTFVLSLATGAIINLGLAPDPISHKTQKNLELAKQNIDILGILKDKTRGNLTPDESQLIESLLAEIRLRFVEASK